MRASMAVFRWRYCALRSMNSIGLFSQDWRIPGGDGNFVLCNYPILLDFGDFVPVTITFRSGLAVIIRFYCCYPASQIRDLQSYSSEKLEWVPGFLSFNQKGNLCC